jgi:S1-C subfamily serine protease
MGTPGALGERGPDGAAALDVVNVVAGIAANSEALVIVTCTNGEIAGTGSGTKTANGTVITAQHVTDGATSCEILSAAPVTLLGSATVFSQQGVRDQVELAVVWTPEGDAITGLSPRLDVQPSIGDFVVVVGHPGIYDGLSLEPQYTTGFVTANDLSETLASVPALVSTGPYWERGWSTDAVAWHGNSGGPVFNEAGEWIGLLVGAFNGGLDNLGPDLSVVIPLR